MLVCTMIVIFSPEGRLSGIQWIWNEYDFVLFTLEVELYSMYDDARFELGAEMTRCRSDLNSFWKGETEYTSLHV